MPCSLPPAWPWRHLLARAQLTVEITGAGANRLPVAIADFTGERIVAQALTSVVRADLERSGLFRLVDAGAPLADNSPRLSRT
jgi:TolB protein